MLERAKLIAVGIGVTYNLADCYERIGRTASAWAGFNDAAAAADVAGQPERAQAARERAAALVSKLSLLRIDISTGAASDPSLDVQRDGVSVSRLLWGKSIPVDPGKYIVSATSPSRRAWSTAVSVSNPGEVVSIEVPELGLTEATTSKGSPSRGGPAGEGRSGHATLGTAIVVGSAIVSLVALEVGIGFTIAANGQGAHVRALRGALGSSSSCYGIQKPDVETSCAALNEAGAAWDTFENAAIANYVVSGLAAAGAITAYIAWPKPPHRHGAQIAPSMSRRGAGLVVSGSF
jgi:hypothetical protein